MQYYGPMNDLTLQASVKKINDRRNNLKHNGLIPAKIEIDDSEATTSLFFKDNTQIVFGIDFDTVSLAQLIADQVVRDFIITAEGFFAKGDYKETIICVAKAYYKLENVHRLDLTKETSHNFWEPEFFYVTPEATNEGELFIQNPFDKDNKVKIDETLLVLNHIYKQNFGFLFTAINNLTLGVDYRDIVRFKRIVPNVLATTSEGNMITARILNEDQLTKEKAAFTLQFIVDFALKVQTP